MVENREEFVEGAIAIQPLRRSLPKYDTYFTNLVSSANSRNPWFEEYLKVYHNCSNSDTSLKSLHLSTCTKTSVPSRKQFYIHFVRDAVYAFAHALHNLHEDACGPWTETDNRLCSAFKGYSIFARTLLLGRLLGILPKNQCS